MGVDSTDALLQRPHQRSLVKLFRCNVAGILRTQCSRNGSFLAYALTCSGSIQTTNHSREQPYVILNDFGGAFAMGAIGGTIWHSIKGARNSPRGDRLVGSIAAVKARAPVVGGNVRLFSESSMRVYVARQQTN